MRAPGEWSPSFMAFSLGCVNCGVPLGMGAREAGGRSAPSRSHSAPTERGGRVICFPAFHRERGRLKVTLRLAALELRPLLTPAWTDAASICGAAEAGRVMAPRAASPGGRRPSALLFCAPSSELRCPRAPGSAPPCRIEPRSRRNKQPVVGFI